MATTKTKKEKIPMDFFQRQQKVFNAQSSIAHDIFVNVHDHQKVTPFTERGVRVLVAKYPDFYKMYLYKYMTPGMPSYPRGGVKVWNATDEQMQSFYLESVAIHPDGGTHRFYEDSHEEDKKEESPNE